MKIRAKIGLVILVALVPLLLNIPFNLRNQRALGDSLEQLTAFTAQMEAANHLQLSLAALPAAPNDYLSTADPAEKTRFASQVAQMWADFAALEASPLLPTQEQIGVELARQEAQALVELGQAILALPDPLGSSAGIAQMRELDSRATRLATGVMGPLHAATLEDLEAARRDFSRHLATANLWLGVGLPLSLLAGLAAGMLFSRRLTRPLHALHQGADALAAGNFGQRLEIRTGDELEQLAGAFNAMARQLGQQHETLEQQVTARTAELVQRNRDLTLLNQVISTATTSLEPASILESVCQELAVTFDVPHAAAALLDESAQVLKIVAEYRADDQPSVLGRDMPLAGNPLLASLMERKGPILLPDTRTYEPAAAPVEPPWPAEAMSLLIVPLVVRDRVLGTLAVADDVPRHFSENEGALAEHAAAAVAQALANARLLQAERQRAAQLETLRQASLELTASLQTTQVLDALLESTLNLLGAMDAYVFFYDGERLSYAADRWAEGYPRPAAPMQPRPGGVTDVVARTGQRLVVPKVNEHPLFTGWRWGGAIVGLPLRAGEQLIGVMNVAFSQPHDFSDDELRLLELLAAQAALALQNARLFAETAGSLARVRRLNEIAQTISSALELPAVLENVVRLGTELVNADAASMALVDPEGETISYPYLMNMPPALSLTPAPRGQGLAWHVVDTGESVLLEEYGSFPRALPDWVAAGVQAIIAVPVVGGQKPIGAFGLFALSPEKHFSQGDLALAETVGRQAGIAIQNARLFQAEQRHGAELQETVARRTAALRLANEELTRALRAKSEFLANMSHELRTPLSSILLRAEMVQRGLYGPLTEKQERSLQVIDEAGHHLLNLINDVLDVSKIEAGKFQLELALVPLPAVCQASLQLVKQMAEQKRITLSTAIPPEVLSLRADERRLKQILVNLLSNAIKFTPERGQVGLDVSGEMDAGIIRFTVWDTGIGIAAEDLPRLFQPFEQLDASLTRPHEGTGLGLALVRYLTEMHQGMVGVESVEGEGSRFTVSLPWSAADNSLPAGEGHKPAHLLQMPATSAGATILLAEDNEVVAAAIAEFLSSRGYHLVKARNGVEALASARQQPPALILMDVQMPVMDGLEAIRRLRADPELAGTPVVALTALAMRGDQERMLQAGADRYLSKPVDLATLVTTIEALLP